MALEYGVHFFIIDNRFDNITSIIFYRNLATLEIKATSQFFSMLSTSYMITSNDSGLIGNEFSINLEADPTIEEILEADMLRLYKEKVAEWVSQEAIGAVCNAS